jgi:hypothetical protein
MSIKGLTLAAILVIGAFGSTLSSPQSPSKLPAQKQETPWPLLDVIKHPDGSYCGLDGAASRGSHKAAFNRLKNRYHLPARFEEITILDLLSLPQGTVARDRKSIVPPDANDTNQNRGVSIVGYVVRVQVLGCGPAEETAKSWPQRPKRGVESNNCYTNDLGVCSVQFRLTSNPDLPTNDGHNIFVVEVTERGRRLAQKNLLNSSIGPDWSIDKLRELERRWVRFSGWLFFDGGYLDRAWAVDPEDTIGKPNMRETVWEIHPVLGIEADVPAP